MADPKRMTQMFGDGDDRERLERHMERMLKQNPECKKLWDYVNGVMRRRRCSWSQQHKATVYASMLNTMLRAMSILKGDKLPAPTLRTGWEDILGEFKTGWCPRCDGSDRV